VTSVHSLVRRAVDVLERNDTGLFDKPGPRVYPFRRNWDSACTGDPIARLRQGELVRLHSMYQSSHPADDVMGVMLLYVNPA
jgi:hypothetical protein